MADILRVAPACVVLSLALAPGGCRRSASAPVETTAAAAEAPAGAAGAAGAASGASAAAIDAPAPRPADWAAPLERPGLPNLHQLSDVLYRGAQPMDEGFAELARMGVRTVINLRTFHSDRQACERYGLRYVHINAQAWEGEDDEVVDFLRAAADPDNQPVFVHCQHGADRTGVMCAAWRMAAEGWSAEAALKEMTEGGFGFHAVWVNLVDYVAALDAARIGREAGLAARGEAPGGGDTILTCENANAP